MPYFVLHHERPAECPVVAINSEGVELLKKNRLADGITVDFKVIAGTANKDTVWPDFITAPEPLVSQALKARLQTLDLPNIQITPATITTEAGCITSHYYLHCLNVIDALDTEASDLTTFEGGGIMSYNNVVLKDDVMEKAHPAERQLFQLPSASFILVDKSIANALTADLPSGLKVIPLDEWHSNYTTPKPPRRRQRS